MTAINQPTNQPTTTILICNSSQKPLTQTALALALALFTLLIYGVIADHKHICIEGLNTFLRCNTTQQQSTSEKMHNFSFSSPLCHSVRNDQHLVQLLCGYDDLITTMLASIACHVHEN
uniref:Uncharacterized protein n=1 Tax=Glossina brevipalpis TaxID=37001 RepID=A0A1A9WST4_9MUSC